MSGFFQATAPNAKIYVGPRAGGPIRSAMENATSSIDIITPYLTPDYLDFLLKRAREGIAVSLVTTTECHPNPQQRRAIFQKLTEQSRHEVLGARAKGMRYRLYSLGLLLMAMATGYAQWNKLIPPNIPGGYVLAGFCALAAFLLFNEAQNITLYTYSYKPRINFMAYVPWAPGRGNDCMLVHAKVYVVDEASVHTGSVNFSAAGFRFNCEVRTDIHDRSTGKLVAQEIRGMVESPWGQVMNPGQIGKSVHAEPRR